MTIRACFALIFLITAASLASAQNSVQSGDVTIHYSAVPSAMLTPEVARQFGVTRSANRALINVSARKGPSKESVAAAASIKASATNLNGQRQTINMREVRDREAIYYLGEARIDENDTLNFDIELTPENGQLVRVTFRQEFFSGKD